METEQHTQNKKIQGHRVLQTPPHPCVQEMKVQLNSQSQNRQQKRSRGLTCEVISHMKFIYIHKPLRNG